MIWERFWYQGTSPGPGWHRYSYLRHRSRYYFYDQKECFRARSVLSTETGTDFKRGGRHYYRRLLSGPSTSS